MLMVGKDVGGMSAQSQPPPPGADGLVDDGELRLEVTCGQNQAVLYTGRLQLGSKGTCVFFENAWLTPNEFQYVSGRETAKDWKRSIKHHGKSLKVLIAKGILSTTPPARCDCGQCGNSSTPVCTFINNVLFLRQSLNIYLYFVKIYETPFTVLKIYLKFLK